MVALYVKLEARPGKEAALEKFLEAGRALAREEPGTTSWFALRLAPTTFAIFDTFDDETGRQAHLQGPIARALMLRADELLAQPPKIERVEVVAGMLPRAFTASEEDEAIPAPS